MTVAQLAIARKHGWWDQTRGGLWKCRCASCVAVRAEAREVILAPASREGTARAWLNLRRAKVKGEKEDATRAKSQSPGSAGN